MQKRKPAYDAQLEENKWGEEVQPTPLPNSDYCLLGHSHLTWSCEQFRAMPCPLFSGRVEASQSVLPPEDGWVGLI